MTSADPVEIATTSAPGAWLRVLRWFAAEFFVVVTGVLVALALNAWWQERQDRRLETAYLNQLYEDLTATEADLAEAVDSMTSRALAAGRVSQAYWLETPPPAAELARLMVEPVSTRRHRPVLGTAEALVSSGDLSLIRSEPLRSELVAYVEYAKARLDDINRYDETYYRPAVKTVRERLDIGVLREMNNPSPMTDEPGRERMSTTPRAPRRAPFPIDFAALLRDRDLYNAYGGLFTTHRNQSGQHLAILASARELRGQVYAQLHGGRREPGNCELEATGSSFAGPCGVAIAGQGELQLTLATSDNIESGRWSSEWVPDSVWRGTASSPGGTPSPVELEINLAGRGQLRTQSGWLPVHGLAQTDENGAISFSVEVGKESEPTDLDAAILRRARELLTSEAVWDRADDRICAPTDSTFSLYCALHRASIEIAGGFHHRRPAMQRVRLLVDARSAGRNYEHRLRDYNNDRRTSLADLHALLDEALAGLPAEALAEPTK